MLGGEAGTHGAKGGDCGLAAAEWGREGLVGGVHVGLAGEGGRAGRSVVTGEALLLPGLAPLAGLVDGRGACGVLPLAGLVDGYNEGELAEGAGFSEITYGQVRLG